MQVQKKYHHIAYLLLLTGLWAFFAFALPEVLAFWEKNQLFRFTSEYWHFFDHDSLGRLLYTHTFLIQFNYYPLLGALVHASVFTLLAWLINNILRHICPSSFFFPGWMVSGLLLPSVAGSGLLWPLVLLFSLAGVWLWMPVKRKAPRYMILACTVAALLVLLREYALFSVILYPLLDWVQIKRENGKANPWGLVASMAGAGACYLIGQAVCAPYLFLGDKNLLFQIGNEKRSALIPPLGYFATDTATIAAVSAMVLLLGTVLRAFFPNIRKKTGKRAPMYLCLAFTAAACVFAFNTGKNVADYQKIDGLCRQYKWQEALEKINRQWEKTTINPDAKTASPAKRLLCGQTRTALLATRKATSVLFTYPHPYFPMLFPIDMINQVESLALPPYYTYAGGFSESLHIDYDFITGHNISANIVNHLILTSIIVDDTIPMLKFVNFLQHSLFYRKQADVYLDPGARRALPQVIRGKAMLPTRNYTVWGYKPDENALRRHARQPENIYFYEYYLAVMMLHKKHQVIKEEMPNIKRYYPHAGRYVAPRHIQEALLANFDYAPVRLAYPAHIEGVDNNTWQDYWQFINDNEAFQSGRKYFSELRKAWGHTYWFYDCYMKIVHFNNTGNRQIN